MRRAIAFIVLFIACIFTTSAQQTENPDSAFALAREENRSILLIFSGSDWCVQCIRFEKKVLNDPSFIHFADSNLILVTADFPQTKKLDVETTRRNEELAQKYNPSGSFPLIVLLTSDQKILAHLDYSNEDSQQFIRMIQHYLP